MSWQEQRQEQRRRDQAARAEQARQDAVAAAQVEAIRVRTQTEAVAAERAQRAELAAAHRAQVAAEKAAEKTRADARRAARRQALRGWVAAHTVDLLIYPLAVVSAVMAVPAMAAFGHEVYGSAAGYALPIITELGMWAFALAVQHTRRHPERPVWALQLGVWSFAAVAAVLNFLHGLLTAQSPGERLFVGLVSGAVMAIASVAGVVAHQLVTAAPRRGRDERAEERMARRAARKSNRVRGTALRAAVAEIDRDGAARLVFAPGRYELRSRFGRWGRSRLQPAVVPGLPVEPVLDTEWDELDRALAELLGNDLPPRSATTMDDSATGPTEGPTHGPVAGPVATLDRPGETPGDQPESTPINRPARARKPSPARRSTTARKTTRTGPKSARSIEALRVELAQRIEDDPDSIDPTSAESIRRALRCAPKFARQLRDEHSTGQGRNGR